MRRIRRVGFLVSVLLISMLLGRGASAHTVNFQIWGYNLDLWAGAQNHYHNQWDISAFPYDFMIPIDTQLRQEAPSSFYWQAFRTGAGNDFTSSRPVKFDLWVWNQTGAQLWFSAAFECDPVTTQGTLFPAPRVYNPSNHGTYEQWSGAGGGFCYDSYTSKDYYGVYSQ